MSESWICPSCSGEAQPNSLFCSYCGYQFSHGSRSDAPNSSDFPGPARSSTVPPNADPTVEPSRLPTAGTAVTEGQVRNVQVRSEAYGEKGSRQIWTFRIERYDNAGNRTLLVPVEMRGLTFEGSISDGDWVRAHGRMRSGTLRITRLENLTTGAVVRARGITKGQVIALCIFCLIFLAFIGFMIYDTITTSAKFSKY